ncbi:MAG: hypothetical protein ABI761_02830 [Saprospiraceae bacterium]
MSNKKNSPPLKKKDTDIGKKINIVLPLNDINDLSDSLEKTSIFKNAEANVYVLNEEGLHLVQRSDDNIIPAKLNRIDFNDLDKKQSFILADITEQGFIEDLENWVLIKTPPGLGNPSKLIYTSSFLKSTISHATILVDGEFVSDLLKLISSGVNVKSISPSLFSREQKVNFEPVHANVPPQRRNNLSPSNLKQYFTTTIQQIKSWPISKQNNRIEHPVWKLLLTILLGIGLLYLIIGGIQVGIGGDEFKYLTQAEKNQKFYTSFGADTSSFTRVGVDALYYNGQLFDNVIYTIGRPLGLSHNFTYRHILTAGMAWLCILITAYTVICLFNYKVAFFTILFMLLTPIFTGNGFNNHRDIPLATGMMLCMYAITRLGTIYPLINRKYLFYLILGMVISFGQRIAGGIMAGFLMSIYTLIILWDKKALRNLLTGNRKSWSWAGALLGAVFIGVVIAYLTWPYGLVSPWKHTLEVFKQSNNLSVALYQIFESKYNLSNHMPNYYVIKYIGITVPLTILTGLILYLFSIIKKKLQISKKVALFLCFAFLFPIGYSYFKIGNFYGSWRHFMFTFPFIAICASAGWITVLELFPRIKYSYASIAILVLTLIHPLQFVIRNHPFEYMYYNELVGGTGGVYGKFEYDYSLNSIKQGSEWLKSYIRQHHRKGTKLIVASNGVQEMKEYFKGFDDSVSIIYTRYYERSTFPWDYAVFPNMYIHPFQLKNNYFPKPDSLHYINIDGKPVCFIYKRASKLDYEGNLASARSEQNTALQKFSAYLKMYPHSEWIWLQEAFIFAQNNNWSQAQIYITECFKHHPEFLPAKSIQGLIYLNTNRAPAAQVIFEKLIYELYDLPNSYKWNAMSYKEQGNFRKALSQYGFALGAGNKEKTTYKNIAECFRKLGDIKQAEKYEAMSIN